MEKEEGGVLGTVRRIRGVGILGQVKRMERARDRTQVRFQP